MQADNNRKTLYPAIEPYDSGRLRVSDLHELYYEQVGNPQGYPVVYLHGGPGDGIHKEFRQFHDPDVYRVVLFEQRGCGKSTAFADEQLGAVDDVVFTILKSGCADGLQIAAGIGFGHGDGTNGFAGHHPGQRMP